MSEEEESGLLDEVRALLNSISSQGMSMSPRGSMGPEYVGVRVSVYQVDELKKRLGMVPGRPSERYVPYSKLLQDYASASAALEAALTDLKDPEKKNAKTIFNMRRLLGIGPDEDPVEALQVLLDAALEHGVQLGHYDPDNNKPPPKPGEGEVH